MISLTVKPQKVEFTESKFRRVVTRVQEQNDGKYWSKMQSFNYTRSIKINMHIYSHIVQSKEKFGNNLYKMKSVI